MQIEMSAYEVQKGVSEQVGVSLTTGRPIAQMLVLSLAGVAQNPGCAQRPIADLWFLLSSPTAPMVDPMHRATYED